MPAVSCPECGFTKEVAAGKLPPQGARLTCPRCRAGFAFVPPAADPAAERTLVVRCPHCGVERHMPAEKLPPGMHRLRCRQCDNAFDYQRAADPSSTGSGREAEPTTEDELAALPPVIDLFERSWRYYRARAGTILAISLLTLALPCFAALLLLGAGLAAASMLSAPGGFVLVGLALAGVAALGVLLLVLTWGMSALVLAVVKPDLPLGAALGAARRRFWAFAWMYSLFALLVTGGLLLLGLPGLLFMVWFLFAQYVLAEEDVRGLNALLKSREYVRGYFWGILLRLLVLYVATFLLSLLLGWIPLLGSLLQIAIFPFSLIYPYLLFVDVKQGKGGTVGFPTDRRNRAAWLAVGLIGYLLVPLFFWLADGPRVVGDYLLLLESSRRAAQVAPLVPPERGEVLDERLGTEPPAVERVSPKEYERLLKQRLQAEPPELSLGPLSIAYDRYWSSGAVPHLWLEVRCIALPNLSLMGEKAVQLDIERIDARSGQNRYDAEHMFEKEAFRKVELQPEADGKGLRGIRDVYLFRGTREEDLAVIRGKVHLNLPTGIRTIELTPSKMGQTHRIAGQRVRFVSLRGSDVELVFPEDLGRLLRVVGYNDSGQPLAEAGTSWSQEGGETVLRMRFHGEVYALKLIMAEKIYRYSSPFALSVAGTGPI